MITKDYLTFLMEYYSMEILSIIPARGGSTGIPMKNLRKLCSKPLLYYSIKSSLASRFITRTIVSTDNARIAKYALSQKAEVIKRPKKLANNKASIEPTMKHVLTTLERKEKYRPDLIILLHNTSPLRTSKHIDEAISQFIQKKYDSLLSGYRSHQFLWREKKNLVYPINYDPAKRPNRQQIKTEFIENGAIYITTYENFMKTSVRISGKTGMYVMPEEFSIDINNESDLVIASNILKLFRR